METHPPNIRSDMKPWQFGERAKYRVNSHPRWNHLCSLSGCQHRHATAVLLTAVVTRLFVDWVAFVVLIVMVVVVLIVVVVSDMKVVVGEGMLTVNVQMKMVKPSANNVAQNQHHESTEDCQSPERQRIATTHHRPEP